MYRDTHDSHYTKEPTAPSWQSLAVCYGLMLLTMLTTWSVLLAAAAVFTAALGLVVARRTVPLVRCLAVCGGLVLEVTDDLRICVVRPSVDGPC